MEPFGKSERLYRTARGFAVTPSHRTFVESDSTTSFEFRLGVLQSLGHVLSWYTTGRAKYWSFSAAVSYQQPPTILNYCRVVLIGWRWRFICSCLQWLLFAPVFDLSRCLLFWCVCRPSSIPVAWCIRNCSVFVFVGNGCSYATFAVCLSHVA